LNKSLGTVKRTENKLIKKQNAHASSIQQDIMVSIDLLFLQYSALAVNEKVSRHWQAE